MDRQTEIVDEIKKECGNVDKLPLIGWHFMYNDRHYLYMGARSGNELRFCIPHLMKSKDCDCERLTEAINETNRTVKYIKAMVLESGSVSLDYDHKLTDSESASEIVPHIIKSLDFASNYLINKIKTV